ncbi:MAG: bile acid:sodium symporter [Phyllobacteriaceae bacterium]|nr:bile acid:sodium symporter [Phyllobacteriaceae bacterium]
MLPRILPKSARSLLPDTFTIALVITLVSASMFPARGVAVGWVGTAANVAITLMFFLYGTKLAPSRVVGGLTHWRLQSLIFVFTYVMFPIVGYAFLFVPVGLLSSTLVIGLVFLTLLPSTIQSSLAFTSIAGGNVPAAMCAATLSNIVGTVLTPLLVALVLSLQGGTDPVAAISEIARLIVAPFVAGQLLRPLFGGFVLRHAVLVAVTDRSSILLIVYGAFSRAVRQGLWSTVSVQELSTVFVLEGLLLGGMILSLRAASRWLGFSRSDEAAAVFCGAKKSLATGVPMAGVLFAPEQVGLILLPVMLFHQIELMTGAWLSRRYARDSVAARKSEIDPPAILRDA